MLEHVEFVALSPFTLCVTDLKSPIADHARESDLLVRADIKTVAADSLPGEVAPDAETSDIATQEEIVTRRDSISDARPDDRIQPVNGTRPRDGAASDKLKSADLDSARDLERGVYPWCQ